MIQMGESNDYVKQDDLREANRDLLKQIGDRFADQRLWSDQRHAENVKRLDFILEQTSKTNGRVSVLEHGVASLKDDFAGIRKRWHDFRDSIQDVVGKLQLPKADEDSRPLTRREVTVALGVAGVTVAVIVWVFTHLPVKP